MATALTSLVCIPGHSWTLYPPSAPVHSCPTVVSIPSPFLSISISMFDHFYPLGNFVSWWLSSLHTLLPLNPRRALWCLLSYQSRQLYNTFVQALCLPADSLSDLFTAVME
ncbi:hypothetical protein BDR07DRAFT_1412613 [Suillus spraguei]|nr:hypothetical protein BDR07DRAFT_1433792 [Suillus spraguei]KAG2360377.1 hypothetical protein BDR07DRAFT_1412613 [Suillus spraguei]